MSFQHNDRLLRLLNVPQSNDMIPARARQYVARRRVEQELADLATAGGHLGDRLPILGLKVVGGPVGEVGGGDLEDADLAVLASRGDKVVVEGGPAGAVDGE
jgi:hypothetical protein